MYIKHLTIVTHVLCFITFALEYAIRGVQVNQDRLKLNGTHQRMVYAAYNILGGSVHTRVVPKVSVLIFYLNAYWTHLTLQVISFKV